MYTCGRISLPAYTPFDSLAHAISLTRAPVGAIIKNFYYPVAANVSRMFDILGGMNGSARTSIIFAERGKALQNPSPMSIVNSIDNHILDSFIPGRWTEERTWLQGKRCEWMYSVTKNAAFADPNTSDLNPQGLAKSGQLFGHCAETYAFILKLM